MKILKEYKEYTNDNFIKWFGNSKVVDDNGNPLVVYHGSTSVFNIFKIASKERDLSLFNNPDIKWVENGVFFSSSKDTANSYTYDYSSKKLKAKVRHAYMKIIQDQIIKSDLPSDKKKELYFKHKNDTEHYWDDNFMFKKYDVMECYLSINNPFILDAEGQLWTKVIPQIFNMNLSNYDGLIIKNVIETNDIIQDTYVVFKPNQIKSSTNNNGEFNPNSDNIYEKYKNNL